MQKKKQHTVPRSYLEKFADPSGLVWVLQETEEGEKLFQTSPENILTGNHFYTIKFGGGENVFVVEDTLANIEGSFATIFREKIDRGLPLIPEERAKVSIFVASLLHRTKGAREAMRQGFIKLDRDLEDWRKQFEALGPKAREASASMIPPSNGPSFNQSDVKEVIEKMDDYHSMMLIEALPELATLIYQMGWGVVYPENPSEEFITSDRPVSMVRPESIEKYGPKAMGSIPGPIYKDVEISLPLSSKKMLLMGWKIEGQQAYVPMPTQFVEQVNLRTIIHHDEKLIASSQMKIEEVQAFIQKLKKKYPSDLTSE